MRATPLIGRRFWFAPRRRGWGLGPVSPEGWAVTSAAVLLSIKAKRNDNSSHLRRAPLVPLILAMVLKGTTPGGRRARLAFDEARVDGFAVA